MGRKDVTIYTCDGCCASSQVPRDAKPVGFTRITLPDGKDRWLCTICYGAIDWVIRFQRITVPPRAFRDANGKYGLRKGDS